MFRNLVVGVCTICCIAAALPPVEALARAGGLTIGRGLMFRSAVSRPALLVGRGRALVAKTVVIPHIQLAPVRRFHRVFGGRLPHNGIGVYYGSIYDPSDFGGTISPPTIADASPLLEGDGAAMLGRRCGSQTVVVPSEAGGERPIVVTRCRNE